MKKVLKLNSRLKSRTKDIHILDITVIIVMYNHKLADFSTFKRD